MRGADGRDRHDDAALAERLVEPGAVEQQRDRWKRAVQMVNGAMGEAVGQAYVARHYPPESERQMAELIAEHSAGIIATTGCPALVTA